MLLASSQKQSYQWISKWNNQASNVSLLTKPLWATDSWWHTPMQRYVGDIGRLLLPKSCKWWKWVKDIQICQNGMRAACTINIRCRSLSQSTLAFLLSKRFRLRVARPPIRDLSLPCRFITSCIATTIHKHTPPSGLSVPTCWCFSPRACKHEWS